MKLSLSISRLAAAVEENTSRMGKQINLEYVDKGGMLLFSLV